MQCSERAALSLIVPIIVRHVLVHLPSVDLQVLPVLESMVNVDQQLLHAAVQDNAYQYDVARTL